MTSSTVSHHDESHADSTDDVRQEQHDVPTEMLASPTRTRL